MAERILLILNRFKVALSVVADTAAFPVSAVVPKVTRSPGVASAQYQYVCVF